MNGLTHERRTEDEDDNERDAGAQQKKSERERANEQDIYLFMCWPKANWHEEQTHTDPRTRGTADRPTCCVSVAARGPLLRWQECKNARMCTCMQRKRCNDDENDKDESYEWFNAREEKRR
jgi:hypothetical protein